MIYDAIVVGLGAAGAATACELAQRGQAVLGLERHTAPNCHASHHGDSRIIRKAYAEHPSYVPLLEASYDGWRRLERESGRQLLYITGSVHGGGPQSEEFTGALQACVEHGLAHEVLEADTLRARFPAFHPEAGHRFVHQPDGGFVASEDAIESLISIARAAGADLRERTPVVDWRAGEGCVEVETPSGTFKARGLVLAAGAWIDRLVPELSRRVWIERQVVGWFDTAAAGPFALGHLPVFTLDTSAGPVFGFPEWRRPGFKIGIHHHLGERVDPDEYATAMNNRDEAALRRALALVFPAANNRLLSASTGVYTVIDDEFFILDLHPAHRNVVIASPCSGHGFKFSPVIGQILSDLVMHGDTVWDIGQHRLARFAA